MPDRKPYAIATDVPVIRSKNELETLLTKFGADQFLSGWAADFAVIGFRLQGRQYRMKLPMPDKKKYWNERDYAQAERSRWRALVLTVKAKLVAVDSGISTVEREFLADTMLPEGVVVWEWLHPQLEQSYAVGRMPTLLPGLSSVPQLAAAVAVEGEIVDG